jgi:pilus assembly protein CpaB
VSLRSVLVVVLALFFGGSAAIGINALRAPPPGAAVETIPVVVAAVDVPRFSTLTADMLKTRDFPKDMAPPGCLTRMEDVVDRVTLNQLVTDETVLNNKLAARGAGRGMAPGIAEGMRAFAIQTPNVAASVAGFILPGNKVDVLLTVNGLGNKDASGGSITTTLLQNVEILAVDQKVEAPADNKVDVNQLRSVTLLVRPDQALKLDLGQNKGTLHLALRNPNDSETTAARRTTLAELGVAQEPPPAAAPAPAEPPAPPPPRVRTFRWGPQGLVETDY